MSISKILTAIKDCYHYSKTVEVTYRVSETDNNIVTYYVSYTIGSNDNIVRRFEITLEKYKVIWLVTDEVGMSMSAFDKLQKAIRNAK